jgi:hypothetical protein
VSQTKALDAWERLTEQVARADALGMVAAERGDVKMLVSVRAGHGTAGVMS